MFFSLEIQVAGRGKEGGCRWEDSDVVWAIRSFVPNLVQCIKMPLPSCRAAYTKHTSTHKLFSIQLFGLHHIVIFLSNSF